MFKNLDDRWIGINPQHVVCLEPGETSDLTQTTTIVHLSNGQQRGVKGDVTVVATYLKGRLWANRNKSGTEE